MANEFPVKYLEVVDELFTQESAWSDFFVQGAEFVDGKTVKVPEIVFPSNTGTREYARFANEDPVEVHWQAYELDKDREKTFYFDAITDLDLHHILVDNALSEWTCRFFVPEYDDYFAGKVWAGAQTKATETITSANIKAELRKARTQLFNAGFKSVDLYVTSDVKYALEDAIDRAFGGEDMINDQVIKYNDYFIHETPVDRMAGMDFVAIGGGQETIKAVMKRAATYVFAPGQHTSGDGTLMQNRWVYGTLGRKNKKAGIYANKAASE